MKKNSNINKYNKGLYSVSHLHADDEHAYGLPNFDLDSIKMPKSRRKHLEDQRKKYGFDDTETWSLNQTACVWLYSHIKMMLDVGGQIVNYDYPGMWSDEIKQGLIAEGVDITEYNTDRLVFDFICELFEKADELNSMSDVDVAKVLDAEKEAIKLQSKAFRIWSVIMYRAGW